MAKVIPGKLIISLSFNVYASNTKFISVSLDLFVENGLYIAELSIGNH